MEKILNFFVVIAGILIFISVWQFIAPQVSQYNYWKNAAGSTCYEAMPEGEIGTRGYAVHFLWTKLHFVTIPTCEKK